MITLHDPVIAFLEQPGSIWNGNIASDLVSKKIEHLIRSGRLNNAEDYNTAKIYTGLPLTGSSAYREIREGLFLECSEGQAMEFFFSTHGLDPLDRSQLESIDAVQKIKSAFLLLDIVPDCSNIVNQLVKAVQVLREPEPEYDVSYSHPEIPFTIFVSVGQVQSQINSIRLAESILHESMHLFLTLIEQAVPMVLNSSMTFYSPWRDTERPISGVLHGAFVFHAILSWYKQLLTTEFDADTADFLQWRIEKIDSELNMLSAFPNVTGLSREGKDLAEYLLAR